MASEKLTGAFIEIYKVLGYPGAETVTLLGCTKDDVEISWDSSSAELLCHNQAVKQNKPLNYSQEVTFGGVVTTEMTALKDLGVAVGAAPETLQGFASAALAAVRVKVYENFGDATSKHNLVFANVNVLLDNITYSQEDYAMYSLTLQVNGTIKRENGT